MQENTAQRTKIEPEPPPSQDISNQQSPWMSDVLHTINDESVATMMSLTHAAEEPVSTPHYLQDTDFCRLTKCECSTDCTKHWKFHPPDKEFSPASQQPTSPLNTIPPLQSPDPFINIDNFPDLDKLFQHNNTPSIKKITPLQIIKGQNDIGANISVTNDASIMHLYQDIDPYHVNGVQKETSAITCSGKGYIVWQSDDGDSLLVPIYYSKEADGTIISPNSIQQFYKNVYCGFHLFCDCDNKTGHLKFYNRDGINHSTFNSYSNNNLWYHDMTNLDMNNHTPKINWLNAGARHELWHQRLLHPGERCMSTIHNYVDGIDQPLKGNCFYRCASCMQGKPRKRNRGPSASQKHKRKRNKKHTIQNAPSVPPPIPYDDDDLYLPTASPGQYFHMDFGFVRGSNYTVKQEHGPTITSKDGFNSYLIAVDRATRYTWIFLTKSKHPPVHIARNFLKKFKSKNPHKAVRTDLGRELGQSEEFRKMIDEEGFTLEVTGAEGSSQNGIAESPNRTYAQMMRCALYSADLGPEYWSYALRLAVYIKNRLPHRSIKTTPYQELTGTRADVSKLKIFGSRVCARIPGADKFPKLDHKNTNGIFLGFTASDNNVYFEDDNTGKVLISTHVLFDEAHTSVPDNHMPLGAQALQRSGYHIDDETQHLPLRIKLLSNNATKPSISTPDSVGIDLYSASTSPIVINPNDGTTKIPTDIAIEPPIGTYARIASRSSLAFNKNVHVAAGVIDPDYRGNIQIGLYNQGDTPFTINKGDRIAQIILEKVSSPSIDIVDSLSSTERAEQGFGST